MQWIHYGSIACKCTLLHPMSFIMFIYMISMLHGHMHMINDTHNTIIQCKHNNILHNVKLHAMDPLWIHCMQMHITTSYVMHHVHIHDKHITWTYAHDQ